MQKGPDSIDHSKVAIGSIWATVGKFVLAGSAFLVAALVAAMLPPYEVGIYFAVLAAATLGAAIASLGVDTPLTAFLGGTYVTGQLNDRSIVVRGFVVAGLGAAIVSLVFLAGFATMADYVTKQHADVAWWAMAGLSSVIALRGVCAQSLRALTNIRDASIVQTLPSVLIAGALSIAIVAGADVTLAGVLLIVGGAHLSVLAVGVALLSAQLGGGNGSTPAPPFREYLAIGIPWLGTSILVFALLQAGVLVVAASSSADQVAQYGVALRVASVARLPFAVVIAVLPPFIVRMWASGDRSGVEKLMRVSATVSGGLAAVAAVVVIVVGQPLLTLVFGDFYVSAWSTLVVLAIGFMADALMGQSAQMLVLVGHERSVLYVFLATTPLTIAAMWILGSAHGAVGVAAGSTIGTVAANVLLIVVALRTTGLRTWATASRNDVMLVVGNVRTDPPRDHP